MKGLLAARTNEYGGLYGLSSTAHAHNSKQAEKWEVQWWTTAKPQE